MVSWLKMLLIVSITGKVIAAVELKRAPLLW
jgi:hypothetical protein